MCAQAAEAPEQQARGQGESFEGLMAAAADNIRTFNHQTRRAVLPDECIPAPDAYRILGPAAERAYAMPQALAQLGDALRRAHRVRR